MIKHPHIGVNMHLYFLAEKWVSKEDQNFKQTNKIESRYLTSRNLSYGVKCECAQRFSYELVIFILECLRQGENNRLTYTSFCSLIF